MHRNSVIRSAGESINLVPFPQEIYLHIILIVVVSRN